jgi:hypothetical protein
MYSLPNDVHNIIFSLLDEPSLLMLKHTNNMFRSMIGDKLRVSSIEIAEKGYIHILQYVISIGCPISKWTIAYAAKEGHLNIIKFLKLIGYTSYKWALIFSAGEFKNDVFKWINNNNRRKYTLYVETIAHYVGNTEIISLLKNGCVRAKGCRDLCETAARKNNPRLLKWLFDKKVKGGRICYYASKNNNLELLKYARENNCSWDSHTTNNALKNNNLEMLKYAVDNGCLCESLAYYASLNNNLEMLKYAVEKGFDLSLDVTYNAATNNNLEMLKYARENNCPWNEKVCSQAALNGNLEMLKWARSNGCPWDISTYQAALQKGHLEILKYAIENGIFIKRQKTEIYKDILS